MCVYICMHIYISIHVYILRGEWSGSHTNRRLFLVGLLQYHFFLEKSLIYVGLFYVDNGSESELVFMDHILGV